MALMSILINYGFLVFGLTDYTGVKFSAHYGAIAAGPAGRGTDAGSMPPAGPTAGRVVCQLD